MLLTLLLACASTLGDGDGDGFSAALGDCDDDNPAVHPDALEICNGLDDDCDGAIDQGASDAGEWWVDLDGDGYGGHRVLACDAPEGNVTEGDDCDDTDPTVHPGAEDPADGVDRDCDGDIDAPVATIDEPEDGEQVYAGVAVELVGRALDLEGGLEAEVSVDDEVVDSVLEDGRVEATLVLDEGARSIGLSVTDPSGNEGLDVIELTAVTNTAPTCAITSPADGDILEADAALVLEATVGDDQQSVESLDVQVDVNGYLVAHSGPDAAGAVAWSGLVAQGENTVNLRVTDELGEECSDAVTVQVGSCDAGYTEAGDFCISEQKEACLVSDAEAACSAEGATVCTVSQLSAADISATELGADVGTAVFTNCCCPCPDNSRGYAFLDAANDSEKCECWTFCSANRPYYCCVE